MLKVLGRNNSSNVQKVMWAIGELGLPHQRVDVGGAFGGNKEPAYLALNPTGLVPTLDDDGFILWESNAIVRYLAARYGAGTLEPADIKTRARANQWMDWQIALGAASTPVFWGLIRTPPEQRDHAAIAKGKAEYIRLITMLDAALANSAYVAGDAFSMGDIPVGVLTYRYFKLVTDGPDLPHLRRWYATLEQRPAFREHVSGIPLT